MLNRLITILSVLILLTLATMGGYYFGFHSSLSQTSFNRTITTTTPSLKAGPDSVVKNQFATAMGEITKADSTNVTLKGADGKQVTYSYSPTSWVHRAIKDLSATPSAFPPATPSSISRAQVKIGDRVTIFLELKNNQYLINSLELELPTSQTLPKK